MEANANARFRKCFEGKYCKAGAYFACWFETLSEAFDRLREPLGKMHIRDVFLSLLLIGFNTLCFGIAKKYYARRAGLLAIC